MSDSTKPAAASDDEAVLKEARDRLALCVKHDAENRRESADDHRFAAGEQWDAADRRMREQVEQRPCLTINKLPAFIHQVVNEQRQNRPSIKVHPVDSGADVETAEVIEGAIKYIEYNSNADAAYDTAVQHATIGGFGYFRLGTDYCDEESFDQDIKLYRVQNPFSVYIDPFAVEADASDMMFAFVTELVPRAEFKQQYPDAQAASADSLSVGMGDTSVVWMSDDSVRVAEYYRIATKKATLCRLNTGQDIFKDELPNPLPEGITIDKTRSSEKRTVEWFKITGADVLERTVIPCKWIPVFPVWGDECIVDGRIRRNGMVRWAKDPQRMYNFWMTSATEEVALRPKTPFIGAVGQFDTAKKAWQNANKRSYSFIEYDPIDVNGTLAPPPARQQMADVPTGVLAMAMHANDNIKATTGIFDASLGAHGNETSGRAILARQKEGDVSNMHFADNLARAIRHAGRCILSMIPSVYDTQRIMRILGPDQKMDTVPVNAPNVNAEPDESGAIKTVLNDLTVGKYDVTISTGPSYTTQRAEAVDAMMQLGQSWPQLWAVAGDKIIRAMDWPDADEIADRVAKTLPPGLNDEEKDQGPQQLPPQVQQALQSAAQEIQQLQQALQEASSGMAAKQLDAQVRAHVAELQQNTAIQVAQINAESRQDVAELTGLVQMLIQKMQPPPELAGAVGEDLAEEAEGAAPAASVTSGPAKRTRKKLTIKAPSGKVYEGTIDDDEPAEPAEPAAVE